MRTTTLIFIFLLGYAASFAQDSTQAQLDAMKNDIASLRKPENSHFMIRGFAQFGMDASSDNVEFNMTSFNPVILWRQGDKFLFESELEMEYMSNQFSLNLGYAAMSYKVTKGLTIKVGKLLLPFGAFGEKLHPSWVNRMSEAPLGLGHDNGMLPMADLGVEIRGGIQLGKSKLCYSLYVVNGPRIKDGTMGQTEAGQLTWENANDNNKNKAIGTRISLLPLSNSSLEIGLSGYYARPGNELSPYANDSTNMDLNYKDVTALLTAIDLSFVRKIDAIKGVVDIKAQYNTTNVSDAVYLNPDDTNRHTNRYTFANNSTSYYAQLAYRPSMLENKFLKNIELTGRYSIYNTPEGSLWESKQTQFSFGVNYWFSWRTVLKIGYQSTDGAPMDMSSMSSMSSNSTMSTVNRFQIHLAMGL